MVGFRPGRGPEKGRRKEGVRGPETIGPEREIPIKIKIGEEEFDITVPPEVFEKGGTVEIEVETREGVKVKVKIKAEVLKRYQKQVERHQKITEELKKTLELPEEVKKILKNVAHLPEIPEILKKLEEHLEQAPEEQRERLKITIEYLRRLQTRLQEITEQTEILPDIVKRLKEDKGFNQAREIIEEWFNNLKEDVYKGLEQIFPDEKERTRFLHNLEQGLISPVHAVNIIAGKFLEILKNSKIRVDEILLEHWVKPLITGIAWYIVDRVLKDYREKLLQELENLEQQFNQADYQELRELLRDLYERIEGESKNKLLEGLGIQKDGFDQFLDTLLKLLKNRELALRKIRYLIISALGIRAREEIFKEINKKVKEIAELVYNKLRNFSTQQTETSGSVVGNMGEAILTEVNKLLSTLERKLERKKMSKEELMGILGKLFIILSEEEKNKFGSNLEEFINKLKTLSEKSEEEALRLLNEFFDAIERKTGRRPSDETVEKIYKTLLTPK